MNEKQADMWLDAQGVRRHMKWLGERDEKIADEFIGRCRDILTAPSDSMAAFIAIRAVEWLVSTHQLELDDNLAAIIVIYREVDKDP